MLFTKSKEEYRYVEVAKYIPRLERVIRLKVGPKNNRKPEIWDINNIEGFRQKHNNFGLYTSVFHYNAIDLDDAIRYGSLYFDFDSEELGMSLRDTKRVVGYINEFIDESQVRLYFTGSKGFHIEMEAACLGVDPTNELDKIYRFIAEQMREELDLPTMDFAVYDPRRMWRLKESQHQRTGLFKNEIPYQALDTNMSMIKSYCEKRRPHTPPPAKFSLHANMWYKEMVATYEEVKRRELERREERRQSLFLKYGTSLVGQHSEAFVQGAWKAVVRKIQEAEANKNRNITLNRQAYRFFLTLLEAGKEPESAYDTLLDLALDIGLERHESKATLNSALEAARDKHARNPERMIV